MNTARKVFIIGPGFIGWNVLELLIGEGYTVTGLVRRDEHAEQIKTSGALAVKGDLNDHDLIVKHVLEHEVRFRHCDPSSKERPGVGSSRGPQY
jgi:nucleoside-diphosphate-sugar epimerase